MRTFAIAALAGIAAADHWAVLIAGSNTYSNYRHQADVHHAYKIMQRNGIPQENIILMSYDDIAESRYNPFPGEIFNQPDGDNVYDQADITYSGRDVNKNTFLAVLKGDEATAGGPVLKSTADSKVFVYFADHGAPGFVCMPTGQYLYADEIQEALTYMKENNMYSELVWYMEACESGSMFPSLTADMNVYAMTAANASESSWGTYCGSDAVVQGKNIGSCLGDLFSVNWMEDTDRNDASTETLEAQYETVLAETAQSHVQKFGDFDIMEEVIGDFEGSYDLVEASDEHKHRHGKKSWAEKIVSKIERFGKKIDKFADKLIRKERTSIDSRDIKLHDAFHAYSKSGSEDDRQALAAELAHRGDVDGHFHSVFDFPGADFHVESVEDFDCYRYLVNTYETSCGKFSDYSLKHAKYLAWACNKLDSDQVSNIAERLTNACQ